MRQPVRLTLFNLEEANRVAHEIRPELVRLARVKREFDELKQQFEVLTLAVAGASPDNPDVHDMRTLGEARDRLAAEIRLAIEVIQRRGCVLKDIDQGLVDFYALSGDRLIHLCWHMGEPDVAHWHTLEGGFRSRQPLKPSELE